MTICVNVQVFSVPDRELWLDVEKQKRQQPQLELRLNTNSVVSQLVVDSKLQCPTENVKLKESNCRQLDYKQLKTKIKESRIDFFGTIIQHFLQ